jgi:uncharacterized membrane protein
MSIGDAARTIAGRSEQVGMFVAATSISRSFQRTLMKRSSSDQAVITGSAMAINYAVAALVHDGIEAVTQWRTGEGTELEDRDWRRTTASADVIAMLAGFALQSAFKQQPGERLLRGSIRTTGFLLSVVGFSGAVAAAIQEGLHSLDERTGNRWRLRSLPVMLLSGAAASMLERTRANRRLVGDDNELFERQGWDVSPGKSLAISALVTTGLAGISTIESTIAGTASTRLAKMFPGRERGWRSTGHTVSIGLIGLGLTAALHRVQNRIESAAGKPEPGLEAPPTVSYVSGGEGSLVRYETLSRQGQRHVNTYIRPEWIEATMGEQAKAHPIRIFVGLDSADSAAGRVALAMSELERTGAFDRGFMMVVSPTGTGYVNYAAVESMEFMTRGDCATVTLQYSKRPSPLSLGRVKVGRRQNAMLFQALWERLEQMPESERPRVALFGESLGAHTSQDAFVHRGTRGLIDRGIGAALWIGTPFASEWKSEVLGGSRFDVDETMVGRFNDISELEAMDPATASRMRYVMLTHGNDAVAYFGLDLLVSCPPWLGPPETRPPGVPKSARYGPTVTFLQTLIDMKNSMTVVPGVFEAKGHDYRADLARFVRAVYRLEATEEQMERIEAALRDFELRRAEWIEEHKRASSS